MKKILLALMCILAYSVCSTVAANDPDISFLKKTTYLDIKLLGNKLQILERNETEKKFYNNFEKYARESIFYSDFDKIASFSAETRIPHKKKYKTIEVSRTETSDIFQSGIFYGGYKNLHFVYPQLQPNAIGKLTYSKTITDPHFIKPFYFQDRHPINNSSYSVSFPKNVKIRYELFGNNTQNIQMDTIEGKDFIEYTWTYKEVPGYEFEENAPSRSYTAPHIMVFIDSYNIGDETISISSSVTDLYEWYNGLIGDISECDYSQLENELKQIIPTSISREDSIKKVFNWVQTNIKYIAFEDGMAGFVPRNACDVVKKRYGDCKDMANLLKSFYDIMGVDAYLTWIGTRKKPYSYESVPSTVADNHMICSIANGNEMLFLDATNQFSDFGLPTSMIQGKEALIGISDEEFRINTVPVIESRRNGRKDSIICKLDGLNLNGTLVSSLTGYVKEEFQFGYLKAEVQNDREYLRDYVSVGGNNIELSNERLIGLSQPNKTAEVQLNFRIPNHIRNIGNRHYINLNLHQQDGLMAINKNREAPIEEDFKFQLAFNLSLQIPEGFSVHYLPENKKVEWSHGRIETSYENTGNEITYTKTYVSDFIYLAPNEFEEWNSFLQEFAEINQETIIITN